MDAITLSRGPFRRLVVIGDSITYGMCAHRPEHQWSSVLADLLRTFQEDELKVLNRGLPAQVLSPGAPGYAESVKPSLMERYGRHCIDLQPDLVIIAEGLNDMRSGMAIQAFMADLETIVAGIRQQTGAVVVLLGIYHQIYGRGANDPETLPVWTKWNPAVAALYYLAVRLVADRCGALFVDVQAAMGGADWTLNPDCCHPNDLGHVLIGHAVFQVLATRCPPLGDKTLREIERFAVSTENTGGADTDEEIRAIWAAEAPRFALQTSQE
jgi:lysophospholipase L1-like esterase